MHVARVGPIASHALAALALASLLGCSTSGNVSPTASATASSSSSGTLTSGTTSNAAATSSAATSATTSATTTSRASATSGTATGTAGRTTSATATGTTGGASSSSSGSTTTGGNASTWVLGYWAVWQTAQYPVSAIAWSDLTHVALSFVEPRAPVAATADSPYTTLDSSNAYANLGPTGIADFATAAKTGGTHPLISLGGAGAGVGFAAAASSANQAQFVSDIIAACAAWGYDGVDLDWEDSIVYADFQSFVLALRAAAPKGFLITVPIAPVNVNLGIDPDASATWSAIYSSVDQLNVETYSGTGDFSGWVVWYFDPLTGEGGDHPFDISSTMAAWAATGIPKAKLGVGVGFYGLAIGPPVTAALQSFGNATVVEDDSTLSYGNIVRYFADAGGAVFQWDTTAQAGWVSWLSGFQPDWSDQYPGTPAPTVQFMSYDDPECVAAKGQWVRSNGYGGTIIWTINEGTQFPYGQDGYANPLLDAVHAAFQ